jgi:hypothetical protein
MLKDIELTYYKNKVEYLEKQLEIRNMLVDIDTKMLINIKDTNEQIIDELRQRISFLEEELDKENLERTRLEELANERP